jgi:hypothetical protein
MSFLSRFTNRLGISDKKSQTFSSGVSFPEKFNCRVYNDVNAKFPSNHAIDDDTARYMGVPLVTGKPGDIMKMREAYGYDLLEYSYLRRVTGQNGEDMDPTLRSAILNTRSAALRYAIGLAINSPALVIDEYNRAGQKTFTSKDVNQDELNYLNRNLPHLELNKIISMMDGAERQTTQNIDPDQAPGM